MAPFPSQTEAEDPVTLLARDLPEWLDRRVVVLRPGEERRVSPADWSGSFVVLEHGRLRLRDASGRHVCLEQGASICPPPGRWTVTADVHGQAVLAVVRRRPPSRGPDAGS